MSKTITPMEPAGANVELTILPPNTAEPTSAGWTSAAFQARSCEYDTGGSIQKAGGLPGRFLLRTEDSIITVDANDWSDKVPYPIRPDGLIFSSSLDSFAGLGQSTEEFWLAANGSSVVRSLPEGGTIYALADDDTVFIRHYPITSDNELLIVVDSTWEVSALSVALPGLVLDNLPVYIEYSPDMNYVFYPSNVDGVATNTIRNLETGENQYFGQYFSSSSLALTPIWRSDSQSVTVKRTDESQGMNYYGLAVDGSVIQYTWFENIFPEGVELPSSPSWSPDGRYLFTRVRHGDTGEYVVIDTRSDMVIPTCFPVQYPYVRPYWSPDSRFIAGNFTDAEEISVIDLVNQQNYSIYPTHKDPYQLVGWVK